MKKQDVGPMPVPPKPIASKIRLIMKPVDCHRFDPDFRF